MELASFYSNHFKSFAQSHKNYCRTEWFLAKPTESSWCQACLCLMPGKACTFTDSVYCTSIQFLLQTGCDVLIAVMFLLRLFPWLSGKDPTIMKIQRLKLIPANWSYMCLSRELRQETLVMIIVYRFGRASGIVPCFSIYACFSSVLSFSFVSPKPQ